MCLKLSFGYLNSDPYPLHSTSTYFCEVTISSVYNSEEHKLLEIFYFLFIG